MVKQVQIFVATTIDELQQSINKFCVDFFPEEIIDVAIKEIIGSQNDCKWFGYIIYQKNGY